MLRFGQAIALVPLRFKRIGRHLLRGLNSAVNPQFPTLPVNPFLKWWIELFFLLIDLLAVPEIYETVMDILKWRTRSLTKDEIKLAKSVFGDAINYLRVRIDERATIACKQHRLYYVSFYTINAWGTFSDDIFIHEMMHIWQFQVMGSIYIPRALWAQHTSAGYNYGGIIALQKAKNQGKGISAFNLEQQADIVSDYYCLSNGLMPRWVAPSNFEMIGLYEYFIKKIRMKNVD
ncbi:MAG: hypothetical protein AAFZ15_19235 [Bacteroidota bacterium]